MSRGSSPRSCGPSARTRTSRRAEAREGGAISSPRIIDISRPLGTTTPEWPGDAPFRLSWTLRRERGDAVNAAEIATSVHVGTHADGPAHAGDGRPAIGEVPLQIYLGPARVVHAPGAAALDESLLDGIDVRRAPRLLFRSRAGSGERAGAAAADYAAAAGSAVGEGTGSSPGAVGTAGGAAEKPFPRDFAALTPALARRLVATGAKLVGVDTPSVDPFDSVALEAHAILTRGGVAILENLLLDDVPEGEYVLIALPLRLSEADSSPVRAVLLGGGARVATDDGLVELAPGT